MIKELQRNATFAVFSLNLQCRKQHVGIQAADMRGEHVCVRGRKITRPLFGSEGTGLLSGVLADQVTAASSSDIRNTFVSEYSLFYGGPEGSNSKKGCKSIKKHSR